MKDSHAKCRLTVLPIIALLCSVAIADNLYWTGGTSGDWSTAVNWWNGSRSAVAGNYPNGKNDQYGHSAYFDQTLADDKSKIVQRTVSFLRAERMRGSVYVYDGTLADPIVFSAEGDYGLSVTNKDAKFQIGKSGQVGWLKLQSGTYDMYWNLELINGGVVVDGADISVSNSVQIGNAAAVETHYVQNGGSLIINNRLSIGMNATSTNVFEVLSGTLTMLNTPIRFSYNAQFLLKGGVVSPTSITIESASNDKNVFLFDGGTLKAQKGNNIMFPASDKLALKVGSSGGVFDTAGYAGITFADDFESAVDSGTDGGMRFTGGGSASITGAIGYTGPTTVELGTVVTIADRANIFGEGKGGLRCSLPNPKPEGNEYIPILTTTGEDDFTASDLTKCAAAEGAGGISFRISGDGKSIMAKRSNGLIIMFR